LHCFDQALQIDRRYQPARQVREDVASAIALSRRRPQRARE
jgi:hypothetical protein